jgi:membrane associated rhomboid family serine protease
MEPELTRIAARSRRQAMDWSLVLVSQGIEPVVQRNADGAGWELLIPANDSEKAFRTLRLYRTENRGWPWPQASSWPSQLFNWTSLVWAALLVLFHWFASNRPRVHAAGVMDSSAVFAGEWWRIFTAIYLHADLTHLVSNLGVGIILLGLTMARFGAGTGYFAAFLAGAIGNVASLFLNPRPFYGLGASGMVMAAIGLLTAQTLRRAPGSSPSLKYLLGGAAAGLMLFAFYGVAEGSDIVAHLGGFVAGFLIGLILVFAPERITGNFKLNLLNGALCVFLLLCTWYLALR